MHAACLDQCRRSADGEWDCHECQRRRDGVALDGPIFALLRKAAEAEVRKGVREAKARAAAVGSSLPKDFRSSSKSSGVTSSPTATAATSATAATAATGRVVAENPRRRRIHEESDDGEMSTEVTKNEKSGERKATLPVRPHRPPLGEGGGGTAATATGICTADIATTTEAATCLLYTSPSPRD